MLHHLPDPQTGFDALAAALAPGGGIGLMVYAPLGRSGVYPLQNAFTMLYKKLVPKEKLQQAKALFARLPDTHPFKCNPHLGDHNASDAGFYDLLLHSSDRPYTIAELRATLDAAGLDYAGTPEPALYDPTTLLPKGQTLPKGLSDTDRMTLAENLRGSFKTHIVYAVPKGARIVAPAWANPMPIPHLRGIDPRRLAQAVAQKGGMQLTTGGEKITPDACPDPPRR